MATCESAAVDDNLERQLHLFDGYIILPFKRITQLPVASGALPNRCDTSRKSRIFGCQKRRYGGSNVSDAAAMVSHKVVNAPANSVCMAHCIVKEPTDATCWPTVHFNTCTRKFMAASGIRSF